MITVKRWAVLGMPAVCISSRYGSSNRTSWTMARRNSVRAAATSPSESARRPRSVYQRARSPWVRVLGGEGIGRGDLIEEPTQAVDPRRLEVGVVADVERVEVHVIDP